jgi:hypothetical protein
LPHCNALAALYVSLVEAPALEEVHETGGDALAYFRAFFPKAAAVQGPLAFSAAALSVGTFVAGSDKVRMPGGYVLDNGPSQAPWLVSGILMGSVIPCACTHCLFACLHAAVSGALTGMHCRHDETDDALK